MRDFERALRLILSIIGWGRAFGNGSGAVARRAGRIKAHKTLAGWMR